MFDAKILPILTYGSEIWFEPESKRYRKMCKYVLIVTKFTSNVFDIGELGRYTSFHVALV